MPRHLSAVRDRRLRHIERVSQAVHERLTREINYLSHRAIALQEAEELAAVQMAAIDAQPDSGDAGGV